MISIVALFPDLYDTIAAQVFLLQNFGGRTRQQLTAVLGNSRCGIAKQDYRHADECQPLPMGGMPKHHFIIAIFRSSVSRPILV